jgi:hypothetical protein
MGASHSGLHIRSGGWHVLSCQLGLTVGIDVEHDQGGGPLTCE